ncbi:hypothetical protein QEN19_001236 [Hanseniaspora menglaensis]
MAKTSNTDNIGGFNLAPKQLLRQDTVDITNCIILEKELSTIEMENKYENLKKQIYSEPSISENKKSKQPYYKCFKKSAFNNCFKVGHDGVSFQINTYTPPNLEEIIEDDEKYKNIPIYVAVHGAGSSSYTFNTLCSHLKCLNPNMIFVSYDLRGHGKTIQTDKVNTSYNISEFVEDTRCVLIHSLKKIFYNISLPKKTSIIFIGHSLGGSICTHLVASTKETQKKAKEEIYWEKNVLGLILLDIIEEVAIDSLSQMAGVIQKTVNKFSNLKQCLKWHLENHIVQNYDSAKFSVPYLFKICHFENNKYYLKRITNLDDFQPYWNTWFTGLSDRFVNCRGVSKLLILSGADQRNQALDKDLMIGQMQGKFQLNIFNNGGHFIHEDCDFNVAITIDEFVKRNDNKLIAIKTNWKSLS